MTRINIGLCFGIIALGSGVLASQMPESVDWLKQAAPFLWVFVIGMFISITLIWWNSIRRITYPAMICLWAWLYDHKVWDTAFSRDTYRVFKHLGKSYSKLYTTVQDAFDYYLSHVVKEI